MVETIMALLIAVSAWVMPVAEDSEAWDCRSMGNHICGETADHDPGRYVLGVRVSE